MPPLIDLTGKKFDRLIVVRRINNDQYGHSMWLCECDCGKTKAIVGYSLINRTTRSCGCLNIEKIIQRSTKHEHSKRNKMSKTYKSWACMIQRCTNPNEKAYYNYGRRGITVCDRWMKFDNFLEDMGKTPKGYQIDRINNDGNYCKSNCHWVTPKEQGRNKRNNHLIKFKNKIQCLSAWAEEIKIKPSTLWKRFSDKWSIERALTTPIRKTRKETK